jgi:hypothetical protein
MAERDWQERAIARSRVREMLTFVDETGQSHAQGDRTAVAADGQAEKCRQRRSRSRRCRCGVV